MGGRGKPAPHQFLNFSNIPWRIRASRVIIGWYVSNSDAVNFEDSTLWDIDLVAAVVVETLCCRGVGPPEWMQRTGTLGREIRKGTFVPANDGPKLIHGRGAGLGGEPPKLC